MTAVVFDIGGVLEVTPRWTAGALWEPRLGLEPGELDRRLSDVWRAGSVGAIDLAEVHRRVGAVLGLDVPTVVALMDDVWREYVGTLNRRMYDYAASLRGRYRTAILSNSFVGAREREQELYDFEGLVDDIVYSHEVGLMKPDPAVFALLCRRIGAEPDQVVFVDDVPENVEAASAFGLQAVRFTATDQAIADVQHRLAGASR